MCNNEPPLIMKFQRVGLGASAFPFEADMQVDESPVNWKLAESTGSKIVGYYDSDQVNTFLGVCRYFQVSGLLRFA